MKKELLITREGWIKINEEFTYLWRKKRPKITKLVSWAASLGDRSENADYKENKRLLRTIDKRIHYLTKKIKEAKVIDYSKEQEGKVYFGAYVTLTNDKKETNTYRIVGVDEINNDKNYISIISPLAKELIGKKTGDKIELYLETTITVIIEQITYKK